ncbi:MAG: beta-ketoacyl-[acyl-carrier-protein] synthase II [Deltaproteobacteria bacterium]|nr:beta-ketoacyl-[acyl-carrier-protein] synthase II [Deltaproteobacteria bacterium]
MVVTGFGCVTPLGSNFDLTFEAAAAGRSGAGPITLFDASDQSCQIAAECVATLEPAVLPKKELRRTDRCVLFALEAAGEALAHSGLSAGHFDSERVGVGIGSGIGGLGTILANETILREKGARRVSPFTIPMGIANMPSGLVSLYHDLKGPNLCHVSACATGSHAIGEGARIIREGRADVMVVGGTEAPILGVAVAGFASMKALSVRNEEPQKASRPFDTDRSGFLIGEGAGVLVLESLEHAVGRGATIRAEVLGYAANADAHHMVAPDPEGQGSSRCMTQALEDGGLSPSDVEAINAHATGTPAGDPAEVLAIRRTFGGHAEKLAVSATKSMTGHLLGAAGAVEAILSIGSMEQGLLLPTINLDQVDSGCELDHVKGQGRPAQPSVILSNSFGFGGTNASLILGTFKG